MGSSHVVTLRDDRDRDRHACRVYLPLRRQLLELKYLLH
jgi:hypothetical protein